jgi:uncharacterized protein
MNMTIRLLWFFQAFSCGAIGMLVLLFSSGTAWSGDLQLFRIGTGGQLGVYYPIGDALARGISSSESADKMIAVAQTSGGSVANVRALILGDIEAGLVQADVAFWALRGEGPFVGEKGWPVRALASLYPESLQILVRRDAGIKNINDFKGKAISLDEAGSGTLAVMRIVLDAHGLTEMDLKPVYLKPEFTTERLVRGKLDGISLVAGTPAQAIADIIGPDFSLVPIETQVATDISRTHPYFVPGVIPAKTYPGISETPTLQVHALFLVREDMSADFVYQLMSALWNEQTRSLLLASHFQGRSVTRESALDGLTVPLHPGAVRFYQEQGMLEGEDGTQ